MDRKQVDRRTTLRFIYLFIHPDESSKVFEKLRGAMIPQELLDEGVTSGEEEIGGSVVIHLQGSFHRGQAFMRGQQL